MISTFKSVIDLSRAWRRLAAVQKEFQKQVDVFRA